MYLQNKSCGQGNGKNKPVFHLHDLIPHCKKSKCLLMLINFLQHNVPIVTLDHLGQLFKLMFPIVQLSQNLHVDDQKPLPY